jgi:quinol monooxygenase YgiN
MTIEWFVPIGQTRPITLALHSLAAETRTVRGCIGCSLATDIGNRGTVRYSEEWLTEEDLRRRIRSDNFSQLATLMDDATQPPRIQFALAHETRGFDFLEEVRLSAAPVGDRFED